MFIYFYSSYLFYSGAITKHFVVTKRLVVSFILESFFSPSQVKNYINDKMKTHLTLDNIGKFFFPFMGAVVLKVHVSSLTFAGQ